MSDFRNPAMNGSPTVFSYTPTGRAIPPSSPLRAPHLRPAAPSCTPTGRLVPSTPTTPGPTSGPSRV